MTPPWYVTAYGEHYYEAYREMYTPEETRAEVAGVVQLLGLTPGARILDLCCGFGRHSLELARLGYQVTGLDLSPALLRHAREDAAAEGLNVSWVEADMRDIPAPGLPYDAVLSLFSAFGIFDHTAEELKVAQAVSRVLKPGGGFLIDTVNREIMLRQWRGSQWQEREDGTMILYRRRFSVETGMMDVREIIIHPDGRREVDEHRVRLWAFTELALLLETAGLSDPRPFGGLDGSRYTWDTHRLVVTARKPLVP